MQTKFLFLSLSLALAMLASVLVFAKGNNQQAINPDKTGTEIGNLAKDTLTPGVASQVSQATPVLETKGVTALALQKYAWSEILTQEVNGVEISLTNFHIENETPTVDVCYQMPGVHIGEDLIDNWGIHQSSLYIGTKVFELSSGRLFEYSENLSEENNRVVRKVEFVQQHFGHLVEWEDIVPVGTEYECRRLTFRPIDGSFRSGNELLPDHKVDLIIHSLYTLPREGQFCNFYQTIQEIFSLRGVEIKIDCLEQDGTYQMLVTNLPEGTTENELWKQISDEFLLFKGPWEFILEAR